MHGMIEISGCLCTWEINRGMNRCTRGYSGVDQVRILQPEPSSERARVRSTECHPLGVGQPVSLCNHCSEVRQVCQRLPAAEEAQVLRAQVTEWKEVEEGSDFHSRTPMAWLLREC